MIEDELLPLYGMRVLDCTDASGHLAGRVLVDLGAQVIKVEPPEGDPTRWQGPFLAREPDVDSGVQWVTRNIGKQSVALDLDTAAGRQRLHELLADADVLLETWTPAERAALALTPPAAAERFPRLVHCAITPYGADGPKASLRGSDLTTQAASGNLFMTGDPDRPPVRCSLPVTHYHAAAEAALGALAAIWDRERTQRGAFIDVAIQELMLMPNMTHPAQAALQGYRGQRAGSSSRVGDTVQPEIWRCKDGWVSFALRGGPARIPGLQALSKVMDECGMGSPVLLNRDWTKHNHNRLTQAEVDEIAAPFAAFFAACTMRELYSAACGRRLMLAPAQTEAEVLTNHQLLARAFFVEREVADTTVAMPGHFAAFPTSRVALRPPLLNDASDGFFDRPAFVAPRRDLPPADAPGLFAGLKVVEFGAGAAAPLAARYLADQGATVIKIESRQRPDFLRTLRDDGSGQLDASLFFACINPNKRSAGLNMKDPRAIPIARRLFSWADVVIENFAPGVMEKWKLDYLSIRFEFPQLIMASTCLLGQTGPQRSYPGFGGQGSALAGFNYLTGWPDRAPLGPFGTITDSLSPRYTVVAIVAALLQRARRGQGCWIDVAQVETGLWALSEWLVAYAATGRSFGRIGNRSPHAVPHGVFPCAGEDRWIALAAHDDADWQRLVEVMGAPAWATDAALATLAGRQGAVDAIEAGIAAWTAPQEAAALAARLQAAGLDAAPVADMQDLLADPQLAHRGHFTWLEHPVIGRYPVEAMGLRFAESPMQFTRPAPCLGADSREVYCDLIGLSPDEFEELEAAGVLS